MKLHLFVCFLSLLGISLQAGENFQFETRRQQKGENGQWETKEQKVTWDASKTAFIICDMWNQHWCNGATERVGEMAPVMNAAIKAARAKGALIIHAPSSCMDFYKQTPQRFKAASARKAAPPADLKGWKSLNLQKEGPLPIDDSDGGCDDVPQCKQGSPWKRQIAAIEISDADAISDSGEEIYNLLQQEGRDNVVILGVHANMCVLGRPFSIRQMVGLGKNVLLMRDMTDTMYNSRMKPFVNHFRGTDLVVRHIEQYWCASTTSATLTGGDPFRFSQDKSRSVVFMIGEPEYDTKTTLPAFAREQLENRGYRCTFILENPDKSNNFPGLETALKDADLLVVSARRRTPPKEQLAAVRAHLAAGKPLVGIRTASHAFDANVPDENHAAWTNFDVEVFGGKYMNHYDNKPPKSAGTIVSVIPNSTKHPVLAGIPRTDQTVTSTLYKARNLANTATPLMNGRIAGQEDVVEPVAWVNTAWNRRTFYTTLGSPDDFKQPFFQRLLLNGILWCMDHPIPPADAKEVAAVATPRVEPVGQQAAPLSPEESLKRFTVTDDLEIEQVLAEPLVRQPLSLSFDERGRLWVVQYLQYPHPAGLKVLSRDNVWRVVYDKVPNAPPNHVRGADKITIHEDTDGDGRYDKHTTFLEGLNIATSVARGRGGVWVLNPPYLLFYPDKNNDDVPDSDPIVHLSGFGLEDSHSVANSLRWGPDGWLYATQGSTVTGTMIRPGLDKEPLHTMGQLVWRYHPETQRFEVFAEGGGNAFGVEIDAKGRIFSGHNGGNTRGFHYVQGGYSQKGFEKHGPLSNPYTFGYFAPMKHPDVDRFTHTFLMYDADALPAAYQGKLFGAEPLQGRIVMAERKPEGSSFQTRDINHPVTTTDRWFRPVDVKLGPDGAIYIADWYDHQVNHYRNHEGLIDTNTGRIYRLKAKGAKTPVYTDLSKVPTRTLVGYLENPNKIYRQLALRILADRKDPFAEPLLTHMLESSNGQNALEALWGLNLIGKFNEDLAKKTLAHPDPYVRAWSVRFVGDPKQTSASLLDQLSRIALTEPDVEVRSQLASTARRLPGSALLIHNLLTRTEDSRDIHIPLLLWWAIEAKADSEQADILRLFKAQSFWSLPLVQNEILERLMRRYATRGTRKDFLTCAELLKLSPNGASTGKLMSGFDLAFKGRTVPVLPQELADRISASGREPLSLSLRRGDKEAIQTALKLLQNQNEAIQRGVPVARTLGEIRAEAAVPVLLVLARGTEPKASELRKTAILALRNFDQPRIGQDLATLLPNADDKIQTAIFNVLGARTAWTQELLAQVEQGKIRKDNVPQDILRRAAASKTGLADRIQKLWPNLKSGSVPELETRIHRYSEVIHRGGGTPYEGQRIFNMTCSQCHKLFGQGGQIGPDLTTYKRDDIDGMLLSVVNPNAEIREGFENFLITTADGQSLTGFLADQDDQVVVLRGLDGENTVLSRAQITEMKPAGASLMPEGLLDTMADQDVRNLFAYLRSTQPLVR